MSNNDVETKLEVIQKLKTEFSTKEAFINEAKSGFATKSDLIEALKNGQLVFLVNLLIEPSSAVINEGESQQFTVIGVFSDDSTRDLTGSAVYSSSDPNIVTINNQGLAVGITPGTSVITAQANGLSAVASVEVESSVAPPINPTVATGLFAATAYLYSGENPVQIGVEPETIDPGKVSVLQGNVFNQEGTFLPGVTITILDHPEFGETETQANGRFFMAVNGGLTLSVVYMKDGFLSVQRQAEALWQQYAALPDVVMVEPDQQVTEINLSIPDIIQVAQGSVVSDNDGTRQATAMFKPGTQAVMIFLDGSRQEISVLTIRATEFTVGELGPEAMPAILPPVSAYTYAVEFSVDQAVSAGATSVEFSQPVPVYVENFLAFPIGQNIPSGFYDLERGAWFAFQNGRVLQILRIVGVAAEIDVTGDGMPATPEQLQELGIDGLELEQLASLYQTGQSLWRVPVTHFTPWDYNWPYGAPAGARAPGVRPPNENENIIPKTRSCKRTVSSVIGFQNQVLSENMAVVGTPYFLHYQSDRVPGRQDANTLSIPLSGDSLPQTLKRIDVIIEVAGQRHATSFTPQPNLVYNFIWDGRDAFGRTLQGEQEATVNIGYVYDAVYLEPSAFETSFGQFGGTRLEGNPTRNEITIFQTWKGLIGLSWNSRAESLGGWTLNVQHAYDPYTQTLILGDGGQESADILDNVINTVAGKGSPQANGDGGLSVLANLLEPVGLAINQDNSFYIADRGHNQIRFVDSNGIITTSAGTGQTFGLGDGGPATDASLFNPSDVSIGPEGIYYIADTSHLRIRKVDAQGIITTAAGNGEIGFSGDGGPAVDARLNFPEGVAVDSPGNLFIADTFNNRIRKVDLNGIITTIAGTGESGFSGDGGPATMAQLTSPASVAVDAQGNIYIADTLNQRIRKVDVSGIITTVAGTGVAGFSGDGGPAIMAQITSPEGVAVDAEGAIYIADTINQRIRKVDINGIITTVAGTGTAGYSGDGEPAVQAELNMPFAVDVNGSGIFYIVDTRNDRIRRVDEAGIIHTIAGRGDSDAVGDGGPATLANLFSPQGVGIDAAGEVYIADTTNHRIRKVDSDGIITTVAGTGEPGYSGDGGPATQARLTTPTGVIISAGGIIYIADSFGNVIRRVEANGIITTVAGTGVSGFSGDEGPAALAQLFIPQKVSLGVDGSLFIADTNNQRIRKVDTNGIIVTISGTGEQGFSGDGGPSTQARLSLPSGIATDNRGNLYIADSANNRIRMVDPSGIITTIAGNGEDSYGGDGGPATEAKLSFPTDVAVGFDGSLYIVDSGNNRIRKVDPSGIIVTIAGTGILGFSGDMGPAAQAELALKRVFTSPGAAWGADGNLYITDMDNDRIRRISSPLPAFSLSDTIIVSTEGTRLYRFNSEGRHLQTLNAFSGAALLTFTYNTDGLLTAVIDGYGNLTTIERNTTENSVDIISPDGLVTTLAINTDNYLSAFSNPADETFRFEYSGNGMLTTITDPLGNQSSYVYDVEGRLVENTNRLNGITTLQRTENENGYDVEVTDPVNLMTLFRAQRISSGGHRSITIDPAGAVTDVITLPTGQQSASYMDGTMVELLKGPDPRFGMQHPINTLTTVTLPDGLIAQIKNSVTTDASALVNPLDYKQITSIIDTNGKKYTSLYESQNNTLVATSPEGRKQTVIRNAQGDTTEIQLVPGTATIRLFYDDRGRLGRIEQGPQFWNYRYDDDLNIAVRTDASGSAVTSVYDIADRVTEVIAPNNTSYKYVYDANGNLLQITMPNGAVHKLVYTADDSLASYIPPVEGSYIYAYDQAGRRISITLPSGQVIEILYNNGGRVAGYRYPQANITFEYNGSEDMIRRLIYAGQDNIPIQEISYEYQGFLTIQANWSGIANGVFTYTYDNDFELTSMRLAAGSQIVLQTFIYDDDSLVISSGPFAFARDDTTGLVNRISDNILNINYLYNSLAVVSRRTYAVQGSEVYDSQLSYDNAGRISRNIETAASSTRQLEYIYDANSQLVEVQVDGSITESYAYDSNGNRTSRTLNGITETAVYNLNDQILQQGNVVYVFDMDGFLVQRGTTAFLYGSRGELLEADIQGQIITYSYDGLGRRVGRTDQTGTTQYLYGDPRMPFTVTAYRHPSDQLTYLYYDDNGLLFAFERDTTRFYVASDPVGSPLMVENSNGQLVKSIQYDSYGNIVSDSNPGFELSIGFAGGLQDTAAGLVRFGFRDYDTLSGRWTSRDPALFATGKSNLYQYAGNNPVNLRDLSGLFCVGISAFAAFGGGAQVCFNSSGDISVCTQLGVGVGGGLSFEPDGDVKYQGTVLKGDISASIGPIGGTFQGTLNECGNFESEFEGSLGVGAFSSSKSSRGISIGDEFSIDGDLIIKQFKFKTSLSATLYAESCLRF